MKKSVFHIPVPGTARIESFSIYCASVGPMRNKGAGARQAIGQKFLPNQDFKTIQNKSSTWPYQAFSGKGF